MMQDKSYKIIREYGNLYGLEELVRRIIRRHIRDDNSGRTVTESRGHGVSAYAEQYSG